MRNGWITASLAVLAIGACDDQPTQPVAYDAATAEPLSSHVFADQATGEELAGSETFVAPSTNAWNFNQQVPNRVGQSAPYVVHEGTDIGEITLKFVNEAPGGAYFEVRIDGETAGTTAHPIVSTSVEHPTTGQVALIDDVIHDLVVGVPNDAAPVIETFDAEELVEVRLALGGERDWDFDWTAFHVPSTADARDACKDGGWEELGFRNQGKCIQHMNTGK